MPRTTFLAAAIAAALLAAPVADAQDKQPTATGTGGAAATVDVLATEAATDALRRGANAVDAAVAAAAVLGVTEPYSAGIGGGGFMVIRTPDGEVTTIDSREESPEAMQPDSFWENGKALAFNDARYSGLSAGVPGTVRGWELALERYGTWSMRRALQAGIRVANQGFTVDQTFVDQTTPNVPYFDDISSTAAIYLDPDGTPRDVGSTLRNPDLGRTYERIARLGSRGFYNGPVADAMVRAARRPPTVGGADKTWRPGLMTLRDVRRYRAIEREPVTTTYRGYEVHGMAPPSSGGTTVGEALNILEFFYMTGGDRALAFHRMLEAARISFADRNAFVADPEFFDVPLRGLLSDSFADERRQLIDERGVAGEGAANATVGPGNPYDDQNTASKAAALAETVQHPRQSTTHLTVADEDGTVVSYTFTIESTGGNGIVVPGWGFLLNNELTDFNFDSLTHPNRADGGKRPRSSMAPTIVEREGEPFLALGSPGGATIITTVLQILVDRLDLGASLPEAIAAPRASQRNSPTTQPETAFLESRVGQELRTRFGHAFGTPTAEIGAATGIEWLADGRLLAAAEPRRRGGGSAMVVNPAP